MFEKSTSSGGGSGLKDVHCLVDLLTRALHGTRLVGARQVEDQRFVHGDRQLIESVLDAWRHSRSVGKLFLDEPPEHLVWVLHDYSSLRFGLTSAFVGRPLAATGGSAPDSTR